MDLNWQKSTRSSGNGGACVEVANLPIEYDNGDADKRNPGAPHRSD
jgi:hypothetical protein